MTLMNIVTAGALALGAGLVPLHASGQEQRVIVTGCAYKADGDGDGFLLANAVGQAKTPRLLYWLDDDDDDIERGIGGRARAPPMAGTRLGCLSSGLCINKRSAHLICTANAGTPRWRWASTSTHLASRPTRAWVTARASTPRTLRRTGAHVAHGIAPSLR